MPEHTGHWTTALGGLALGAGYHGLTRIDPGGGGLGLGEVKLAVGAGVVLGWYGWPTVMLGAFAGFLVRAVYEGLVRMVHERLLTRRGPATVPLVRFCWPVRSSGCWSARTRPEVRAGKPLA